MLALLCAFSLGFILAFDRLGFLEHSVYVTYVEKDKVAITRIKSCQRSNSANDQNASDRAINHSVNSCGQLIYGLISLPVCNVAFH